MTALKEVLAAEQEAEQAIETASNEVQANIAAAQTASQIELKELDQKLIVETESAIVEHEQKIAVLVEKVESETQTEVVKVVKAFQVKNSELQAMLTAELK